MNNVSAETLTIDRIFKLVSTTRFYNNLQQLKVERINQLTSCWQKISKWEMVKFYYIIQISLSMNTCNFVPVFKPHTHKLYILGHCCCLFILLTIRCLRWIISYCLIYPRRCIYNACCISMIFNIKCKTHNRYNLYYTNMVSYWPDRPILTAVLLCSHVRKLEPVRYYPHLRGVVKSVHSVYLVYILGFLIKYNWIFTTIF